MNWNNLKSYKCPKDSEPLKDIGHYHACTKCVFSINKEKFDSIVSEKLKPRERPIDNFEALQNLGHEEVAEDFSDSPYLI